MIEHKYTRDVSNMDKVSLLSYYHAYQTNGLAVCGYSNNSELNSGVGNLFFTSDLLQSLTLPKSSERTGIIANTEFDFIQDFSNQKI
ncbi:hypothetical protein L1887_36175 [Cichorium endivia]|nr:hypothetical protein L1887_36175 [Cichorium endivia]